MRLGIFAKTFPGTDPDTVFRAAAAAGYQAVQYNMACSGLSSLPDAIPDATAASVRTAAREHGIAVAAVSGTYNMIHPDPAIRADGMRRLGVLLRAAGTMGTGLVTLCTGTRNPHDQWEGHPDNGGTAAWRDLLDEMGRAATLAEEAGVLLGIEPELANVVDSAAKTRRLIDELGSPALRVVLDPANLFEVATPDERRRVVADAVAMLADRIVLAHAKDRAPDGRFVAAGTGVLDYPHYLGALRRAGFDGALVTHGLHADEAEPVGRFLRDALAGGGNGA